METQIMPLSAQKVNKLMLPPLGYSSQHAAFNLIVRAVGHHILQLLVLIDV
jgi:hypothetical protein